MKWIKCSDTTPPIDQLILISNMKTVGLGVWLSGLKEWHIEDESLWIVFETYPITHWCKLELPLEKPE